MSTNDDKRIAKVGTQGELISPAYHAEIDGIEMGVLENGVPYLTARGLASLCGAAPSTIIELGNNWAEESAKPRGQKIRRLLLAHDHDGIVISIPTNVNGQKINAHSDAVSMAILEYYAFEVGKERALLAYRILARQSLREFIFQRVGYRPADPLQQAWRNYQDLVALNICPPGYFSVFQESAGMLVTSIRQGLLMGQHTVPDISVGQHWSAYWESSKLNHSHNARKKHPHIYPDWYPQSKASPEAWVYPLSALGEFRQWMQDTYLPTKYPSYLLRKVKKGELAHEDYTKLISAIREELYIESDSE